ncbi:exonuclease SbcCD subunit D [Glaciihabitans arcticus]|uniref:Nuclease SbcCD subunit D n=1 Tax=Glaciihabitans arcticus TaxID=2668039 RepID=A0A4Q9GVG0_9MICO|nr:exonuclease SbcCD subunit D [Glaciihabitans arcticus]TBN56633.1 exonuclease SbcCD subunit D [Glaciihabitans arcticus]
MRILHTSDWHIGRTFHGNSTLEHLESVLEAMVEVVKAERVDVVVVAGDIFDSATPAAENYEVLTRILRGLRGAGAQVILTSGNHDSATRLGFNAGFTGLAGIHIITRQELHDQPIVIDDEHGQVWFYGIPYLEPALLRHHYPDETLKTHEQVLGFVMGRIRASAAETRSVVISHAFISDVQASDVERDISSGGLDLVPLSVFDGPDYVALGHIHGRAQLSPRAHYSGAPLHYSFGEGDKPRGAWIVDLDASGLQGTRWVDLPIPRRLTVLTGTLDDLLRDDAHAPFTNDWVSAVLTDTVRPLDAMRRLRDRFPHAAAVEYRPAVTSERTTSYGERTRAQTDNEVVAGFLELVRNGVGPSEAERALIAEVITEASGEATA